MMREEKKVAMVAAAAAAAAFWENVHRLYPLSPVYRPPEKKR